MFDIEEIVIHDHINAVETWIEQFSLSGGDEYLKIKEGNIDKLNKVESIDQTEIVYIDIFIRVDGVPWKVRNPIRNQFYIQTLTGELAVIQKGQGYQKNQLILASSDTGNNLTTLYVNWDNDEIRPYIIKLFEHLSTKWPEVECSFLKHYPSPFEEHLKKKIFSIKVFSRDISEILTQLNYIIKGEYSIKERFIYIENNLVYDTGVFEIRLFHPEKHKEEGEILLILETKLMVKSQHNEYVFVKSYPKWVFARFEISPSGDNIFEVVCYTDYDVPRIKENLRQLETNFRLSLPIIDKDFKRDSVVNVRTQLRAEVFAKLKKENPHWTQAKVALEATSELGEAVSADTVRYTYRKMDWTWERGDRTR